MATAQAVAKGSVMSPYGNRAVGFGGRRRGAVAARMSPCAPAAMRIGRKSPFLGARLAVGPRRSKLVPRNLVASPVQMNLAFAKSTKWWEKGLQPNMREIESAQDLVDSLANAGDRLVVVDFFSPGCGGCRALHPKICQFAEHNPDVLFLQVNYEEHKSMCYSLHVHVLPFFRFYRGAQGRLCSFSCTNATIKKFRDALAKHNPTGVALAQPGGWRNPSCWPWLPTKTCSSHTPSSKNQFRVERPKSFLLGAQGFLHRQSHWSGRVPERGPWSQQEDEIMT